MFFVGFWRFSYDRGGLSGFNFEPLAFFCERKVADLFARYAVADSLTRLYVVFDLVAQKPYYFSLSNEHKACEDFCSSLVYSCALDDDVPVGSECWECDFLEQLHNCLEMFHVEQFTTKM